MTTIANGDLTALRGTTIGSGAADIDTGTDSLITMKCAGCGAEVVVNTAEQMGARCHWCRHVLTVNEQVPNGAVPDAVLPFKITHDDAMARIREFAGKRRIFADRAFVRDFKPENVVGVYMPYMVVDGNVSADVAGFGEIETRQYTRGSGDNKETVYDADVYAVERHIDFTVDDLTIESSSERSNTRLVGQHQQRHQHDPAVRHRERGAVERQLPHGFHVGEARPGRGAPASGAGRPDAVDREGAALVERRAIRPRRALGTREARRARHALGRDVPAGLAVLLLPREGWRRAWCTTSP